jgi:hypothetical protein
VLEEKNWGVLITCRTTEYEAQEVAKTHITWHYFKTGAGWCVHMMQMNGFSVEEPCFARHYWQTLRSSFLLFSDILDFEK